MRRARRRRAASALIVYNRKEGRALGEVTKFLVYNARKRQEGGDQAATYFERTECVAGVQDARFQQLMPDVLHWLGITPHRPLRVDVQHEIRRASSARHRDRRARADSRRAGPAGRQVEMEAKKAAGYFTPESAPSAEDLKRTSGRALEKYLSRAGGRRRRALMRRAVLLSARAVRERAHRMLAARDRRRIARIGAVDLGGSMPAAPTTSRRRSGDTIPLLTFRFTRAGGISRPAASIAGRRSCDSARWTNAARQARAAFDLAIVCVLLDAGAGPDWRYRDAAAARPSARSEGLAVASFDMFAAGAFSADRTTRCASMRSACAS